MRLSSRQAIRQRSSGFVQMIVNDSGFAPARAALRVRHATEMKLTVAWGSSASRSRIADRLEIVGMSEATGREQTYEIVEVQIELLFRLFYALEILADDAWHATRSGLVAIVELFRKIRSLCSASCPATRVACRL
jgi:hypothetical protein